MSVLKRFKLRLLWIPVALAVMILAVHFFLNEHVQSSQAREIDVDISKVIQGKLFDLDKPAPSANQVLVGFYPLDVYDLDFSGNTYKLTGYLWLRWKGDVDPVSSLEFLNAVDEWDFKREPLFDQPQQMPDGSFYQCLRINGLFFQSFDFTRFPLDRHQLTIELEDTVSNVNQLVLVYDEAESGIGDNLKIPGWKLTGLTAKELVHDYGTNFGDLRVKKEDSNYANLRFEINMQRNPLYFILKLFFPMLIVLLTNWFALVLRPTLFDVRMALPTTALLTLIFLQMEYTSGLPKDPNPSLMDKIYIIAYLMVAATLFQVLRGISRVDENNEDSVLRMVRKDRVMLVIQVLVFAIGLFLLIGPQG